MRAPVMLLLPLLLSAYPAIGKEATGLTMLGPCKSALHNGNARLSWYCVGAIDTIRLMGNFYRDEYAFCPKKDVSTGEMIHVLVRFMQRHPQILPRNFVVIAMASFQTKWPCEHDRKRRGSRRQQATSSNY
jgi:hypothetical protein